MYFVCYLKSGKVLEFNCDCKYVDYSDRHMCAFETSESGYALGIVPYENILYIEKREDYR